jgi:hypothetical protein
MHLTFKMVCYLYVIGMHTTSRMSLIGLRNGHSLKSDTGITSVSVLLTPLDPS